MIFSDVWQFRWRCITLAMRNGSGTWSRWSNTCFQTGPGIGESQLSARREATGGR